MSALKALLYSFLALLVIGAPLIGCGGYSSDRASAKSRNSPQPRPANGNQSTDSQPLKLPLVSPRIEVWKADRKMLLFSEDHIVRTYHVGLGLSPVGDKVRSGDHRTPEGEFYIFTKNPKSAFYLSLGISYPNLEHARRGLRDGLITHAQYERIAEANKRKQTPPQNTRLGGTIYIHGNGSLTDWTWGCVAVENYEVKELFDSVPIGTPVTIKK